MNRIMAPRRRGRRIRNEELGIGPTRTRRGAKKIIVILIENETWMNKMHRIQE